MWQKLKQALRESWAHKAFRASVAILVGALIGSLCAYLPETFRGACHLAAKILHGIIGAGG